ncbi:hypothetical protein [Anthocerotibacter panamensis]|uniref:hypothetical protein n=1 Tax=Anthocerotibacter panamensis TaxID=2857077 RepID=UPI001C401513|nr:hypothetical protein [Anthocerotibacter panamensis]
MPSQLEFQPEAESTLELLKKTDLKKLKKVQKTLGLLERNPRHPSLQTHDFDSLTGPNKEKVFESYVENNTPAAWRVFWYYGPGAGVLTIIAITPHP